MRCKSVTNQDNNFRRWSTGNLRHNNTRSPSEVVCIKRKAAESFHQPGGGEKGAEEDGRCVCVGGEGGSSDIDDLKRNGTRVTGSGIELESV